MTNGSVRQWGEWVGRMCEVERLSLSVGVRGREGHRRKDHAGSTTMRVSELEGRHRCRGGGGGAAGALGGARTTIWGGGCLVER